MLTGSELSDNQAQSVANAIQLIREAGYENEADFLDDELEEGDIEVDDDPNPPYAGLTWKISLPLVGGEWIYIDKKYLPEPNSDIIERNDPRIVALATILLHEAKHGMCHGELAAYGTEIAFLHTLNRKLDELFEDASDADKRRIEQQKLLWLLSRIFYRLQYAKRIKPNILKRSKDIDEEVFQKLQIGKRGTKLVRYPSAIEGEEARMDKFVRLIMDYKRSKGRYPTRTNKALVKILKEQKVDKLRRQELNRKGLPLDSWGNPYVYICPGKIHPKDFDFYSIGPNGKDEGGYGDDIFYLLYRM